MYQNQDNTIRSRRIICIINVTRIWASKPKPAGLQTFCPAYTLQQRQRENVLPILLQLRRAPRIRKRRRRLGVRPVARHRHHTAAGIGGCRDLDSARARGSSITGILIVAPLVAVNVRVVRPADSVTVKALVPL